MALTEKELNNAWYVGHKLDNSIRKISEKTCKMDFNINKISVDELFDLMNYGQQSSDYIKWMVSQLRSIK